jgi:hypothetical protein
MLDLWKLAEWGNLFGVGVGLISVLGALEAGAGRGGQQMHDELDNLLLSGMQRRGRKGVLEAVAIISLPA